MKRALPIACAAVTFLLLGRIWSDLKATAQQGTGAGEPATDERFCADANGDGTVNLSDALSILNFLFLGAKAPYCIAENSDLLQRISALEAPKTFVSVRMSTPQNNIPRSTLSAPKQTKVRLNAETADTLGEFNTGTYEFTAQQDGVYLIHATATWNFPNVGVGDHHHLYILSSGEIGATGLSPALGEWAVNECSTSGRLTAGQKVWLTVDHWQATDDADLLGAQMEIVRVQ
jgi:hypothetical protein